MPGQQAHGHPLQRPPLSRQLMTELSPLEATSIFLGDSREDQHTALPRGSHHLDSPRSQPMGPQRAGRGFSRKHQIAGLGFLRQPHSCAPAFPPAAAATWQFGNVWKRNYLQPLEGGFQPGKQAHVQVPWGAVEPRCLGFQGMHGPLQGDAWPYRRAAC